MSILPLISHERCYNDDSLWIKIDHAKIEGNNDSNLAVNMEGTVALQCLQNKFYRLQFQNFFMECYDRHKQDPHTQRKQNEYTELPKICLFLSNRRASFRMIQMEDIGYIVKMKGEHNYHLNSFFESNSLGNSLSSFNVILTGRALGLIQDGRFKSLVLLKQSFDEPTTDGAVIYGFANFDFKAKDFRDLIPLQTESTLCLTESGYECRDISTNSCIAIMRLELGKNYKIDLLDQYLSVAKRTWKSLNLSSTCTITFEKFKIALNYLNISCLEGRARLIFKACDPDKTNCIGLDEFVVSLMVNDTSTIESNSISLYDVFSSFDIDELGELTLIQFLQCVRLLEESQGMVPKSSSILSDLFRRETKTSNGRMSYGLFKRVYAKKIANAYNELVKKGFETDDRRSIGHPFTGSITSVRKMFTNYGSKLLRILDDEDDEILTNLKQVRYKIVEMRTNILRKANLAKQKIEATKKKQNRLYNKNKLQRNRQKRCLVQVIHDDYEQDLVTDRQVLSRSAIENKNLSTRQENEIITSIREKHNYLVDQIKKSGGEKLVLKNLLLKKLPIELNEKNSLLRLSHLIILDISGNRIEYLPGVSFVFHLSSLRKMCLSRNAIRYLPPEISALGSLELLDVSNNRLEILPEEISQLRALIHLNFANNKVSSLNENICSLNSLRYLGASSNIISKISKKIGDMKLLEVINLDCNNIRSLPASFPSLFQLKHLNLSNNKLTELPLHFGQLTELKYLDLSYNLFQNFPDSIRQCCSLAILSTSHNRIFTIPNFSFGCEKLIELDIQSNALTRVCSNIGYMVSLQHLCAPRNAIEDLSSEIGMLTQLVTLNLQSNCLKEIPVEIGALVSLSRLDLSHNHLTTLPHEFCLLRTLDRLDVSNNNISKLPTAFGAMNRITSFNASKNNLSEITSSFRHLKMLRELNLSGNDISIFHSDFCIGLQSLVSLNLSSNRIFQLPANLTQMKMLKQINLENNKLKAIPVELADCMQNGNISINIKKNLLDYLPPKWNSVWNKRQQIENPSGYSNMEVKEWLCQESMFYKTAVETWNEKSEFYLSGFSTFDYFLTNIKSKLSACIEKKINDKIYPSSDIFKEFIEPLKAFYFKCRRHGYPPHYSYLNEEEICKRKNKSLELIAQRTKEAAIAKEKDSKQRKMQDLIYYGNLKSRIDEAEVARMRIEKQRRIQEKEDHQHLISDIKERIKLKHFAEETARYQDERKTKEQYGLLIAQVTGKLSETKGIVPIKIIPCWKSRQVRNDL